MKVAFRVDSSFDIGTGHVMRCLTLAEALAEQKSECHFICRNHPGNLTQLIRNRGFEIHHLELSKNRDSRLLHSDWLGATQHEDAISCKKILAQLQPNWLVVDHYGLDANWEQRVASNSLKTLVIDDLADRDHYCDGLLDQNFHNSRDRYQGLVPDHCVLFEGPYFALLNPAYHSARSTHSRKFEAIKSVLIFFSGGPDHLDAAGMALKALSHPSLIHTDVKVVIGRSYKHRENLKSLALHRGKTNIFSGLPDLADLMKTCDLAIGAGGSATWERCCMGVPSLIFCLAHNQRRVCEDLASEFIAQNMGDIESTSVDRLIHSIRSLDKNVTKRRQLSMNGQNLVDGRGTSRIVRFLSEGLSLSAEKDRLVLHDS